MPDYESEFITLSPEMKRTIYDDYLQNRVQKHLKGFHGEVEKALDEYFQFQYGISNEQLETIIKNTNNFKLKHNNFQKVIQGYAEYYYDGDFLFLMVNTESFNIYKRW